MPKNYKRKSYYHKNSAQSKFIFRFVSISILSGIATVAIFNYLAHEKIDSLLYSMRLPKTSPGGLLWNEMLLTNAAVILFTLIIFTLTARALYVKVHGPLKKMTSDIEKISEGDLNFPIVLRKKDEFRDLGDELNVMVKNFNHKFSEIKTINDKIKSKLESFDKDIISELDIKEIEASISQLESAIGSFKK